MPKHLVSLEPPLLGAATLYSAPFCSTLLTSDPLFSFQLCSAVSLFNRFSSPQLDCFLSVFLKCALPYSLLCGTAFFISALLYFPPFCDLQSFVMIQHGPHCFKYFCFAQLFLLHFCSALLCCLLLSPVLHSSLLCSFLFSSVI